VHHDRDGAVLPGFVAGGEELFVCVDAGFNHIAISVKLCQYYGQITGNVNNIFDPLVGWGLAGRSSGGGFSESMVQGALKMRGERV